MSDKQDKTKKGNVQANENSIAIGSFDVSGDVSGRITIGHAIGYTADEVAVLIEQISTTFQPKEFDGRCPYKGLDVFEEEDSELFFGREKLVNDLVERVRESRTLFITGPSGSGKSSLIRAGLIPALKQGAIKNSERWFYETVKPGRDPVESLALAFSRLKSPELGKYFRENLHQLNVLHECAESALSSKSEQHLVLFFDQFEEVFTQVSHEHERALFLNLLTHAATVRDGRTILLFAMRSDFVANCASYPQFNELLGKQFKQISAMQPDELVSAIAQPALRVGLRIDPDLVVQIINDMQREPGALPLMQFALKDLFDFQQARGGVIALTRSDYLHRGGIQKMLARHADVSLTRLSEKEQELARAIFSGLIEIGRGTQDTKRTAVFNELVPSNSSTEEAAAILQKLGDARLVTTEEGKGDQYTITHEKLIDAWPWLKKLVDENRDVIALQNQIATDAKEWEEEERDPSYLYSGARLASASEQLQAKKLVLSGLAQEFIRASSEVQEQKQRERERLRRRIVTGLAAATFILAALSIVAFSLYRVSERDREAALQAERDALQAEREAQIARDAAEGQRQIATARQWSAQSLNFREQLPQRSLLLAIEANTLTLGNELAVPEAEEALRQALSMAGGIPFHKHGSSIFEITFSPGGKYVLLYGSSLVQRGKVTVLRMTDPLARAPAPSVFTIEAEHVLFRPDGQLLVAAISDNDRLFLEAWNPDEGSKQRAAVSADRISEIRFSPGGQFLIATVIIDSQKRQQLWEGSGSALSPVKLPGDETSLSQVGFSPPGNYLFTRDTDGTVRVWSAKDLTAPLMTLPKNEEQNFAAFSPDETFLATWQAGRLGPAQLWNFHDPGAPPIDLSVSGREMWSLFFSPDGRFVITANQNGAFARDTTDLAAPAVNLTENMSDPASTSAIFSPDGRYLIVRGWYSGVVRAWRTDDLSSPLAEFNGYNFVAFSPDSRFLVFSDEAGFKYLWSMAERVTAPVSLPGAGPDLQRLEISPDSRFLLATKENLVYLWQTSSVIVPPSDRQEDIPVVLRGHENTVVSAEFSPEGRYLLTGDNDGDVRLWGLDGFFLWPEMLNNASNRVRDIVFSPDEQYMLALQNDGSALLWDTTDPTASAAMLHGHDRAITSAAFSNDSRFLVTVDSFFREKVWVIENLAATLLQEFDFDHVFISPDGNHLIRQGFGSDTTFSDLRRPLSRAVALHEDVLPCCVRTFSPDGEYAVRVTQDSVFVHATADLDAPATFLVAYPPTDNDTYIDVKFSPDGRHLLTQLIDPSGSLTSASFTRWAPPDVTAHLWDMENLSASDVPVSLVENTHASNIMFSPSGRRLINIHVGGVVWLWDLDRPSQAQTAVRGSPSGVSSLAFSPDERYFVMGGHDGAARVWDMENLDAGPVVLLSHEGSVRNIDFNLDQGLLLVSNGAGIRLWRLDALDAAPRVIRGVSRAAFSPDGRYLLMQSANTGVQLMSLDIASLMDLACKVATRNLSWREWQQFMDNAPYQRTCPEFPPHPTVAPALVALGEEHAWQGDVEKAKAAFQEAQQIDPSFTISANSWNDLCWFGSLVNRAADVLDACANAIKMEPENGKYRDSRGLARALSDDTAGAIEDFEFVVRWARENEFIEMGAKRQSWLDALNAGENPFSQELLADLRLE